MSLKRPFQKHNIQRTLEGHALDLALAYMGCFDALCGICITQCASGAGLHRTRCYLSTLLRRLLSPLGYAAERKGWL